MSDLDHSTIKKLTDLSRIDCGEEEEKRLVGDLNKILRYVKLLEEVDTDGVAPCYHPIAEMHCPTREDEVGEVLDREEFLRNSPSHIGGMIRVPPVFKKG